jgi:hypothetical protein
MIEGLPADEFVRRNADPIWLHQHGYWEYLASMPTPDAPEVCDPPAAAEEKLF